MDAIRVIRRTLDARHLNEIANHPEVFPFLGAQGVESIDLTEALGNVLNIGIEAHHGGWVLFHMTPGEYDLHTMFSPEGRGAAYFRAAKQALRYVFTRTDCLEIFTKCPDSNPGAHMAAIKVGFRQRFHLENAWKDSGGVGFYALTVDDWCVRDVEGLQLGSDVLAEMGFLHREAHARTLGCALLMIRNGQPGKGLAFYNRWCRISGMGAAVQIAPNVLDIQGTVIEVQATAVGVLSKGV